MEVVVAIDIILFGKVAQFQVEVKHTPSLTQYFKKVSKLAFKQSQRPQHCYQARLIFFIHKGYRWMMSKERVIKLKCQSVVPLPPRLQHNFVL